jgi:hypothetical protein
VSEQSRKVGLLAALADPAASDEPPASAAVKPRIIRVLHIGVVLLRGHPTGLCKS